MPPRAFGARTITSRLGAWRAFGNLIASLNLDTRGFDGGIKKAVASFGGLQVAGVAAGLAIAGSLIQGLKEASQERLQFQYAMQETFNLIPNYSKLAYDRMSQQVRQFAREASVTLAEAAEAAYQGISAGVVPGQLEGFLEASDNLAKAWRTDLPTAVTAVNTALNAYGFEASKAAEISDQLYTIIQKGVVRGEELGGALAKLLPVAADFGLGINEIGSALAALTRQGSKAGEASTQVRQILVQLSREGAKADKVFRQIAGESFPIFIDNGNSLRDALELIKTYTEDTGKTMFDVFGRVEAASAALTLTGKAGSANWTEAMSAMETSTGNVEKAADEMRDTTLHSWKELKSNVGEITDHVFPALKSVSDVMAEIVSTTLTPINWVIDVSFNVGELNLPGIDGQPIAGPSGRDVTIDDIVSDPSLFRLVDEKGLVAKSITPPVQGVSEGELITNPYKGLDPDEYPSVPRSLFTTDQLLRGAGHTSYTYKFVGRFDGKDYGINDPYEYTWLVPNEEGEITLQYLHHPDSPTSPSQQMMGHVAGRGSEPAGEDEFTIKIGTEGPDGEVETGTGGLSRWGGTDEPGDVTSTWRTVPTLPALPLSQRQAIFAADTGPDWYQQDWDQRRSVIPPEAAPRRLGPALPSDFVAPNPGILDPFRIETDLEEASSGTDSDTDSGPSYEERYNDFLTGLTGLINSAVNQWEAADFLPENLKQNKLAVRRWLIKGPLVAAAAAVGVGKRTLRGLIDSGIDNLVAERSLAQTYGAGLSSYEHPMRSFLSSRVSSLTSQFEDRHWTGAHIGSSITAVQRTLVQDPEVRAQMAALGVSEGETKGFISSLIHGERAGMNLESSFLDMLAPGPPEEGPVEHPMKTFLRSHVSGLTQQFGDMDWEGGNIGKSIRLVMGEIMKDDEVLAEMMEQGLTIKETKSFISDLVHETRDAHLDANSFYDNLPSTIAERLAAKIAEREAYSLEQYNISLRRQEAKQDSMQAMYEWASEGGQYSSIISEWQKQVRAGRSWEDVIMDPATGFPGMFGNPQTGVRPMMHDRIGYNFDWIGVQGLGRGVTTRNQGFQDWLDEQRWRYGPDWQPSWVPDDLDDGDSGDEIQRRLSRYSGMGVGSGVLRLVDAVNSSVANYRDQSCDTSKHLREIVRLEEELLDVFRQYYGDWRTQPTTDLVREWGGGVETRIDVPANFRSREGLT